MKYKLLLLDIDGTLRPGSCERVPKENAEAVCAVQKAGVKIAIATGRGRIGVGKGLLRSIPSTQNMNERLIPIGGTPINMLDLPKGCAFCPRCDSAMKICLREQPVEMEISDTHHASCWMNVKNAKEGK